MQKRSVAGHVFDGMADRMTEIQEGSISLRFPFVTFHEGGLYLDAPLDQAGQRRPRFFNTGKKFPFADNPVFDDLREAFIPFATAERRQRRDVCQYRGRLVEGADKILPGGQINTGFTANGAVDLRHNRCGNLNHRNASVINCSGKSSQIPDHTAAKGHDKALAVDSLPGKILAESCHVSKAFGTFAGCDDMSRYFESGICERSRKHL